MLDPSAGRREHYSNFFPAISQTRMSNISNHIHRPQTHKQLEACWTRRRNTGQTFKLPSWFTFMSPATFPENHWFVVQIFYKRTLQLEQSEIGMKGKLLIPVYWPETEAHIHLNDLHRLEWTSPVVIHTMNKARAGAQPPTIVSSPPPLLRTKG